jgi:hypothetical protein
MATLLASLQLYPAGYCRVTFADAFPDAIDAATLLLAWY